MSDTRIIELCEKQEMIRPFHYSSISVDEFSKERILSKGLSSYGYDATLGNDVYLFKKRPLWKRVASKLLGFLGIKCKLDAAVDPKRFDNKDLVKLRRTYDLTTGESYVVLPPHSYTLGHTVEYFKIPRNVLSICLGKSTLARCGIIVNVTPLEPGFEGVITLEFSNATDLPVKLYIHEGVCQFIFFEGDDCNTSYADRNGKYQNQVGVTTAR